MSTPQLNTDDNNATGGAATVVIGMGMNTRELVDAALDPDASSRKLTCALLAVGLLTLATDLATALYRPPRGAVFERRELAYYLTLAANSVAGAAEVAAAFRLSCSSGAHAQDEGRRDRLATSVRAVLFVPLLPLVLVVALSGVA